ncbi:hypothetical protein K457DRAFT_26389 [Linnemannia elongata AG-77]|uniref:Uncharacterized protein n=1 Tax=Linnemannia elongata AG-77 TaxID=1314771 RepID=A0A197JAJ3_9FUNG|nr:hypothetical protein K457DRAFT_26389 [Linnemannia elongata AG-77]
MGTTQSSSRTAGRDSSSGPHHTSHTSNPSASMAALNICHPTPRKKSAATTNTTTITDVDTTRPPASTCCPTTLKK